MTHLAPRPAVDVDRDPDPDAHPPRYLGFPTAARFRPDVGAAQADDWLGALPRGSTLELHVHVPFCLRLCRFCCCRTQAARDAGALAAYVAALGAEASRVAGRLPEGAMVTEMHWFGGSPTILTPTLIRALDARIRAALPLAPGAPLSVEIEPHGVDPARLDALFEAGLTCARLGLQDFDLGVQRAIGREQDPARVAATFAALRARGVSGVAAELLYGLPLQDRASLLATCARLLALAPDRVTLVGYAHMPWMAKRQRSIPEASLPDAAARRDQFVAAVGAIRRAGYARCGVDQFALPGDAAGRRRRRGAAATRPARLCAEGD